MNPSGPLLSLPHGLKYEDLYEGEGLLRIDTLFLESVRDSDAGLFNRLMAGRANPDAVASKDESQLLIDLAPYLEDFLGELFGVAEELRRERRRHQQLAPLYEAKRQFVQRRAAKAFKPADVAALNEAIVLGDLPPGAPDPADEVATAEFMLSLTGTPDSDARNKPAVTALARYAAWALYSAAGQAKHRSGVLFKAPHKLDPDYLVPVVTDEVDGVARMALPMAALRTRQGFALTDAGTDLNGALDQANYCIWCHHQGKDSCSKGLTEKDGSFKKSPFGVPLAGCPLEEKISEMNLLKSRGFGLGALAVAIIDNPMVAGTGHRICNDCMKACIYQKQEPVDIPQVETRTLKDVLALPWGFEIYSLLTRWNPLNLKRPVPKPPSGYKVLVIGLGPAGSTLAHHLMNDGHTVVAIDGLKVEPLQAKLSGVDPYGARVAFEPVRMVDEIYEALDERVMAGFGGVAEYGITVRWDKNFLKLIRLLLERRSQFAMYGGVRFGGTLGIDQAFELGFDHIALCAGAGRPTVIDMPNGLARGVRQASDFLMALQLTGAARKDSIANLQIRLPVVVIGGGLTAIDTATEALAYYPVQVEKFLQRHETLAAELGEVALRAGWSAEDNEIADAFIAHARAIHAERKAAQREGRAAALIPMLQSWGGATVAYRRRLTDAPSYTLNHEEVHKALEEGIVFAEALTPVGIDIDGYGAAKSLRMMRDLGDGGKEEVILPARAILIAAGTQPNTVLAREDSENVHVDGKYFQAYDEEGNKVTPERVSKPIAPRILMSLRPDGRAISFFGDLHPSFSGNVVKAMGGAKQGYPVVTRVLSKRSPTSIAATDLIAKLNDDLRPTVHAVERLAPNIVEVILHAPLAARAFQPGQFYRLQNYETLALRTEGANPTTLAMEGLALTGAWIDPEQGLVSTIVLEMGGSSDLCSLLKPGEPVVLMGPTGTPTDLPSRETVLLAGGGLGNAVLFSIGQELRAKGSKVVYFAGYRKLVDRYKAEQIEASADLVIWCSDEAPGFIATRPQDRSFVGNIVEAMLAYAEGSLGQVAIPLRDCQRIIAIGSDRMMAGVSAARHGVLRPYLSAHHEAIGSINSPMQCMMKEICGQCLQQHKDPMTGKKTVVFSCFEQDQRLDHVDWLSLNDRLSQNSVQEKLTTKWIARCMGSLAKSQPSPLAVA